MKISVPAALFTLTFNLYTSSESYPGDGNPVFLHLPDQGIPRNTQGKGRLGLVVVATLQFFTDDVGISGHGKWWFYWCKFNWCRISLDDEIVDIELVSLAENDGALGNVPQLPDVSREIIGFQGSYYRPRNFRSWLTHSCGKLPDKLDEHGFYVIRAFAQGGNMDV